MNHYLFIALYLISTAGYLLVVAGVEITLFPKKLDKFSLNIWYFDKISFFFISTKEVLYLKWNEHHLEIPILER